MTTAGYEYSGAGAEVGLTAWGEDLAECLRQCALGVFNLIVPTASVQPLEGREVAARGASSEALLVNWLNECLYVHELEGFVVADVVRPEILGTGVHALLGASPSIRRDIRAERSCGPPLERVSRSANRPGA
jgi:SHS2 domain-containing protein